jgi:hypothetical protein
MRAVCVALTNAPEPLASLKIPRIVHPDYKIVRYFYLKDVEFIKSPIERGEASPNDTNGTSGRSAWYVSMPCLEWIVIQSQI